MNIIYANKIIDSFIFYNELDLLSYRLNILANIVDYFVIVESTHTFSGSEKKLYYNENKHLFDHLKNKIIHIIVDDMPYTYLHSGKHWDNEKFQRNAISRGLSNIDIKDNDIITISDLDEIPDPNTLNKIKSGDIPVDINALNMDLYYYNLNTKCNGNWISAKIIQYSKYKELKYTCDQIRSFCCPQIEKGGWHLSYFGDSKFIKNKIESFSHQEYNNDNYTNETKINKHITGATDLFGRPSEPLNKIDISQNTYLPVEYDKYLTKYYSINI